LYILIYCKFVNTFTVTSTFRAMNDRAQRGILLAEKCISTPATTKLVLDSWRCLAVASTLKKLKPKAVEASLPTRSLCWLEYAGKQQSSRHAAEFEH
jgi:hypothetical protein